LPGKEAYAAWFPDLRQPADIRLGLYVDQTLHDERTLAWQPQRHWEVHLIHYAHHDLGYTDLPSRVLREYEGVMDQVLRFCAETESWPEEEARFRYQCEQAWSVVHYLERRPPEVAERLAHYARLGQIEVTALYGNQTLELCGHEELVRLLYPAHRLQRALGIEVASAEHNDIPGFPWGLASVLAGAGIRYFSPGVPRWYFGQGDQRVHPLWDTAGALPLEMPAACWWEGPDGARVLLWSDLHGQEWQPYNLDQAQHELPAMLQQLEAAGYPYDMVSYTLRGGHRDNAPPTNRYAYLAREWNRRWAYPRLINTTNTPFLRAFERRWGHTLRTLRGDVPGTDYPVAATCTPKETAVDRSTHEVLGAAEKLDTLAALHAGHESLRKTLDEAYRETFNYDLHCWGLSHIGGPAQDGHWSEKGSFAYRAAALAHDVWVKSGNALADRIWYPESGLYLTLFNTLSHERRTIVRISLRAWSPCGSPMHWRAPSGEASGAAQWPALVSGRAIGRRIVDGPAWLLEHAFAVIDLHTGERVPVQLSRLDGPQAAWRWAPERWALGHVDPRHLAEIAILAPPLPPMGYRSFAIVRKEAQRGDERGEATLEPDPPPKLTPASGSTYTLENRFYRLTLDLSHGGVASLYDRELQRELVDANAAHLLGQLIVRDSRSAEQEIWRSTEVSQVEAGALYTTIRLRGTASCCPRVGIEITLYHALKRVDLRARILRDSTPTRELYLAFPFLVEAPRFRFEAPGSVIEPIHDQWPGSSTDAYGVQHWVHVGGDGWGVTWTPLDTPLVALGGLWPGYVSGAHHGARGPSYGHPFLRAGELARGHIYALISYNNFRTNFPNVRPDEYVVRYSFCSLRGDWREARAWQTGWDVANPPLPVWMNGPKAGLGIAGLHSPQWAPLPTQASFCQVDAPNVILLTFKQAEDGNGVILRLMETAGCETEATLTLPTLSILGAWETNLVEETGRPLPHSAHSATIVLAPYAMRTLRIRVRLS
jgi:hypothetical protein